MIDIAQRQPEATGRKGLSLIVPDAKAGALRLYARAGFREVAARAMVKEDWVNPGTDRLLLMRD